MSVRSSSFLWRMGRWLAILFRDVQQPTRHPLAADGVGPVMVIGDGPLIAHTLTFSLNSRYEPSSRLPIMRFKLVIRRLFCFIELWPSNGSCPSWFESTLVLNFQALHILFVYIPSSPFWSHLCRCERQYVRAVYWVTATSFNPSVCYGYSSAFCILSEPDKA